MFQHPDSIITSAALHQADLLATAARERRAATVAAPALPWRALPFRAVSLLVVFLGVRG